MKMNEGKIPLSFDYCIAAERIDIDTPSLGTSSPSPGMMFSPSTTSFHPQQENIYSMPNMAMMNTNSSPMYPNMVSMPMDGGGNSYMVPMNNMTNMNNNMMPYNQLGPSDQMNNYNYPSNP